MTSAGRTLEIRSSPHVMSGYDVGVIMRNVVLALVPTVAFAVAAFGLAALATLTTALAACLATEWVAGRMSGEEERVFSSVAGEAERLEKVP